MKHFLHQGSHKPGHAYMLFEVRLELQDVRSGYRGSQAAYFAGEWLAEPDLDWTRDMVFRVETDRFREIRPPAYYEWPETADQKMIRYLVHNYRPRILRNPVLDLYSFPLESRDDFLARCRETLHGECSARLQQIKEVFVHRFLEAEQRLLEMTEEEGWAEEFRERRQSRIRTLFNGLREDFSRCFLKPDFQSLRPADFQWKAEIDVEYRERVDGLKKEFIDTFNRINCHCEEQACQIEPYEVPLSYDQIDVISTGILWK